MTKVNIPKTILMRELTWEEITNLPTSYLLKYYKYHAELNSNKKDTKHGVPLINLYSELGRRGYNCHIELKWIMIIEKRDK